MNRQNTTNIPAVIRTIPIIADRPDGIHPDYVAIAAASCSQALIDAESRGWQTRYDGTAFCPSHRFQKGHQK